MHGAEVGPGLARVGESPGIIRIRRRVNADTSAPAAPPIVENTIGFGLEIGEIAVGAVVERQRLAVLILVRGECSGLWLRTQESMQHHFRVIGVREASAYALNRLLLNVLMVPAFFVDALLQRAHGCIRNLLFA